MNAKHVIIVALLAAAWQTALAQAQALGGSSGEDAEAVIQDGYLAAAPGVSGPSPSDRPSPPVAPVPDTAAAAQLGPEDQEQTEDGSDQPRRLIGKLPGRFEVYGWLDMGITGNASSPPSRYNGPLAPNDREEFQFNQTYLVIERTTKADECSWDLGARADLLYGTDYIYGISTGFETHPDGSPRWNSSKHYGLILPQIYGEVARGDLSFKFGRFYTIIGYESLMAPNNFFYSMNYALRYAEPTTHTGGLFTWKATDQLSLYIAGANGQDRTDALSDSLCLVTGFGYTPQSKKWALSFAVMTGGREPTNVPPVFAPRTYLSTVFTWNFNDRFQSVTQYDTGWQENYDLQGNDAEFYSITQYLFYTINDCWKAGFRYDWFRDDDGTRLGGLRFGGVPGGNPLPLPSGNAGAVHAISLGLNYTPNANLRIRPEVRWDWYEGAGLPLFDDRTRNSQFTGAVDLVVLF